MERLASHILSVSTVALNFPKRHLSHPCRPKPQLNVWNVARKSTPANRNAHSVVGAMRIEQTIASDERPVDSLLGTDEAQTKQALQVRVTK
jgi:hypothetical protein